MADATSSDDEAPDAESLDLGAAEEEPEEVDGEVVDPPPSSTPRVEVRSAEFRGPLPPPDVLRAYGEVVPGLDREIVDQWKAETAHRHKTIDSLRETDRAAMDRFFAGEKRGQIFGFIAIVLIIALAALAVVMDYPLVGLGMIFVGAGAMLWAMRRSSIGPAEPTDLADGDEIERKPSTGETTD